jgi:hypothetical protein
LVAELDAIDNEELKLFVDDRLLNLLRQVSPDLIR